MHNSLHFRTKESLINVLNISYFASSANANTPAASGAAADVPECVVVHFPYKSVVACNYETSSVENYTLIKNFCLDLILTTPVFGSFAPLLKVEANVDEQLSS